MATTRRTSQRVTLLMLVLASITVLTLDYHGEANKVITSVRNRVGDGLSPIQRAIAAVLHPIGDAVSGAFHYGAVQQQNQVLMNEIGTMRRELAANNQASAEARSVLALDHLPWVGNLTPLDAVVLAGPSSNFEYTMEIDRGSSSGVAAGMPVVGASGFVGTVVSTGANHAVVRLLQDPRSTIGVRIGDRGTDLGIVTGAGRHANLAVTLFSSHTPIHKGELVYTSGTSGSGVSAYPAGIPVATVTSVHATTGGLGVTVSLRPLVDPTTLEYVAVLLWTPPA
ncbi:MAG: rod shape-determining protein MreC [Actinomycetota bacterium]|nr:rod shape-determining protein MreC [Actinomycetota bacterium]